MLSKRYESTEVNLRTRGLTSLPAVALTKKLLYNSNRDFY